MSKERVDVLLVEQGFFTSREQAKRAIMEGVVYDDHERIDKPGTKIDINTHLMVKGETLPYVSRGGLKLEKALKTFNIQLNQRIMLDIGSSTGGFTDCALQNGAKLVYAVDVGTNQLAWKLRIDERVIVMEKKNFRYGEPSWFLHGFPSFASIDVSFISLKHIFPPLSRILVDRGEVVALIKPQFEAERNEVGKKGIIKDPHIYQKVIRQVIDYGRQSSLAIQDLTFSPITGGNGNIEFLAYFIKGGEEIALSVDSVIDNAVLTFRK